jgi:hypothetical protein
MSFSDWIIDIALLLIVFRQLREERLRAITVVLPLALVGWAATHYLHGVPTAGNDLGLVTGFAAIGVVFGLAGGLLTRVRYADGSVRIKASLSAAALWVVSMGFRLGFAVWSSHPSGVAHLTHFSIAHDITTGQAWVTALVLMAFGEVLVRVGTIVVRGRRLTVRARRAEPVGAATAARPGSYV